MCSMVFTEYGYTNCRSAKFLRVSMYHLRPCAFPPKRDLSYAIPGGHHQLTTPYNSTELSLFFSW